MNFQCIATQSGGQLGRKQILIISTPKLKYHGSEFTAVSCNETKSNGFLFYMILRPTLKNMSMLKSAIPLG